ncbi:MAG: T9SS type A sorting domain-containing protein [Candidatus Zixiibacteriota bacterium]|nr:MAG: T9SS type A sorting domain-containing protein [candidate division Zixibacteria bacterium]
MKFNGIFLSFFIFAFLIPIEGGAQLPDTYTRYNEALRTLSDLAADNPAICRLDTMGYSTRDSIPMLRMKISDNVHIDEDEPAVFYCGGVHGDEVLGVEVVINFIQDIIRLYNLEDPDINRYVDNIEIFCVPYINPEGHIEVEGGNTLWRKNKCDNDDNGVFDIHDGVDNNRNYDFGWDIDISPETTTPESLMFKGTAPFTQLENIAMADFGWHYRPLVALDYHSPTYGRPNVAYYPWYWYSSQGGHGVGPDEALMQSICQSFTSLIAAIPDDSSTGTYTARRALVNKGDLKTYFYGNFGSASFTVEISDTTIQDPALMDSIVTAHLAGQYYLLERVLGPGITGVIRDSVTLEPIEAEVQVQQHINTDINPRLSRPDHGRYRRLLAPGSYTLVFLKDDYQTKTLYNVAVSGGGPTETDILLRPLHPRPPAPEPEYPPQDTTLTDNTVTFIWNSSIFADYYLFELYYEYDFPNPAYIDSAVADTSFVFSTPLSDSLYVWRVKGGNENGWGPCCEPRFFTISSAASYGYDYIRTPSNFRLRQNRPNPFNPSTRIEFDLPVESRVDMEIFNVLGQIVDSIYLNSLSPGKYAVTWNGSGFPSGVYFYKLMAGEYLEIKKMTLLK